ncbi:hypothetical protein [Burkholderia stagnalis]|uniref:hypothetical protein n=1 Tax=Burkholderia stagnalis TaxID=1503054 RepID=UPI000F561C87|nr:hypothetical protein [Burkholderia stagnalis]RQQ28089.1 hypothetical protein DF163_17870 [Burkholderia stagnalis]RQQ32937.1 hypothetical protein DF149_13315 [Burkholderia stagnalis]RQQ48884.1 hypothetical protein DF162_15110 [Burkholderia stagnalis]RQY56169.1 hypothetical protein DF112_13135 [Burkholderia stagnalis]RQY67304.1 hypothetical protein DF109_08145 [Burkholderia stagnalis]
MSISFSLGTDGGAVTQQSTFGGGGSNSFSGGPGSGGQSSGGVAQGGMDVSAYAQGVMRQGVLGSGVSLDALNKLTGGIIQGYVDRKKKEQYAEGMAQAAQGKSLIDIENDQPWYTKLYGPDATVQGAQAFNMAAAMQDAQSQFMQAMPQLREKSPDQVRQYIVSKMGEVKSTGDPAFDSMVQQGLAEQLPRMLSTHMSQYMQFTQEQAYNGFTNLGSAGGRALQDTLTASNNLKPEDIDRAGRDYANQLLRPDNMTLEAHQRGLRDIVLSNAQAGNWQAVRAIKEMPEYQVMPTEMKDNLEVQIPRLEQEWANKNPAARNLFTSRADLQWSLQHGATGFDSSPEGHAKLDAVMDWHEDSNRRLNGDATAVYNNAQRAQLHVMLNQGNAAKLAQLQKLHMQQLNYDQAMGLAMDAVNNNAYAKYENLPFPAGSREQAADTLFNKATSPQFAQQPDAQQAMWDKLSAASHYSNYQSPALKQVLIRQLPALISGNGPATSDMQQALQYAGNLYKGANGPAAVEAYLGSHAPKVVRLLNSGIDIMDPEQLKQQRHLIAYSQGATATPQDIKLAADTVNKADPGWFKKMMPWGGNDALTPYNLTDGAKRQLANVVAPIIAQYKTAYNYSDDDAAKAAFGQVMKDSDFVPGAFILHNAALGQSSFASAVNSKYPGMGAQTTEIYQNAVQHAIDQEITNAGGTPKDWAVSAGENLGNGYMSLFMIGPNGAVKHINITADTVGRRVRDTFGNKPEHEVPGLSLSSKNAWGWAP